MYVILLRNKNAGQQGVDFVKYEIGDFVSKPVIGICKIENILYLNPQDEKNDKLYYLMKPVEDEKDKIYVPVSSSDSRLRLCLTKEEAWNLIKRIPDIPTAWTNNEKMREQNYKEAVRANNPEALVAIIKMIYQRKQKRLAQGKKCTATDARYFQIAENLLYMELGVALEKPKQEIIFIIATNASGLFALTATDARYFQIAENLLYMELGVALEKPKQEICKTIIDYIDQNKID